MDVEKTIREYLPKIVHMSLATCMGNRPWVCEVHFAYDENLNLYFRSLKTRRHSREIARNPHVAGNIVIQHTLEDKEVVGIYFEGTAKILEPGNEQQVAAKAIQERLGAPATIIEEAQREDGHKFYKISVETWYVFGRFGAPSGQKFTLPWHEHEGETL